MVRNDIKKSSLLRTKVLIYAFNGGTKKFTLGSQTRKVKWCKIQFVLAKLD